MRATTRDDRTAMRWASRSDNLRGNRNAKRKLTEADVALIREAHAHKLAEIERLNRELSVEALARKFGVHRRTIEQALARETWARVR